MKLLVYELATKWHQIAVNCFKSNETVDLVGLTWTGWRFLFHVCILVFSFPLLLIIIPGQCSWCCHHAESSIAWFTRWMQHGARWPPIFGPSRSTWTISPPVGCQLTTLTVAILLLLSPKDGTHFTISRRVEGWVELAGYILRWFTYHTVTHPTTNRVWRRVAIRRSRPTRYR